MACSSEQSETTYPSVIELNVGGQHFTTTLMTLTKRRDTMLGAMFSGMHRQPQDKHGRYFIDADGDTFIWILSYLRTGELPPTDKAERVYHAALYFGLQDLAAELEYTPKIMAQQIKAKHYSKMEQFDATLKSILSAACKLMYPDIWPKTKVWIAISHKDNTPSSPGPPHTCCYVPKTQTQDSYDQTLWKMANVTIGPLQSRHVKEIMYMDAVVEELKERGFSLQLQDMGFCRMGEFEEDIMHMSSGVVQCNAKMYCLLFSWK